MKKLFFLFCSIVLLVNSSCKKEYTCVCTTSAGIPGLTLPNTETNLGKLSKKKAESQCSAKNTSTSFMGYTLSTSCSLK